MRTNLSNGQNGVATSANVNNTIINISSSAMHQLNCAMSELTLDTLMVFVGKAVDEDKKDVDITVKFEKGISIHLYLSKDYYSNNYVVVSNVALPNGKGLMWDMCSEDKMSFKVLSGCNINKLVGAMSRIIMDKINALISNVEVNNDESEDTFVENNVEESFDVVKDVEVQEFNDTPCLDEDMEINDTPCLDEMRANRIAKIVNDNWVEKAVEDYVKLDWSLFDEQDMELMFADNDFAKMVYDRVCESNKYFSECLAYDDCFYVWLTEDVGCILVDYLYDLDSRPAWVDRHVFDFKDGGDYLDIVMFGRYHIGLYYVPSYSNADFAKSDNGDAYGKRDMEYAVEIMDNRDMILALAEKSGIVKHSVDETIEKCNKKFNNVA